MKVAELNERVAAAYARVVALIDNGEPDVFDEALGQLLAEMRDAEVLPIPMRLSCPECGLLHIDEGEFATKPHHTHSCQGCGLTWRPAVVHTVGVRFLPGFRDATPVRARRVVHEFIIDEAAFLKS